MESSSVTSKPWLKPLLCWISLLPLLLLVFYPALNAPFLLDDSSAIVQNNDIRTVSVANLMKLVRGHANVRAVDHHPVSALSLMLDYQWAGLDTVALHVSNLLLHWLAAGVVFLLSLTVWKRYRADSGQDPESPEGFWLATSLMFLWAVHPFATMPVSYITCRQETLLCLFYMLSMLAFLRQAHFAAIVLGVLGFLCKEVAVTLPGALYLLDWVSGGKGFWEPLKRRPRFYACLTTVWLMICFYHLRGGRRHEIFAGGMPLATSGAYFKAQCGLYLTYVGKLFWPSQLQFYPYIHPVESWQQWVPGLVGLVVYFALAVYAWRISRWLFAACIFPLLVLSPTSSVLPIPYEPFMEYRMYLPSVAFIGLILMAIWKWVPKHVYRLAIVALLIVPLGVRSHLRTRDYETALKLYERDLAIDSKSLTTLEGLVGMYHAAGLHDRAREIGWRLVDWSLAENNKEFASRGFNGLGAVEYGLKNYQQAKEYFRRSNELHGNWGAKLNLAAAHVCLYELEEGEKLLNQYLLYWPDNEVALSMLFEAKMSAKKLDEAEKVLDQYFAIYPENHHMDVQRTRLMNFKRRGLQAPTP